MADAREGSAVGKRVSTIPPRAKLVRPKGQGTISYEGGMYRARLPAPSRMHVGSFPTFKEAQDAIDARVAAVSPGASEDARAITLGDWMATVLRSREQMRLRAVYYDTNRSRTHIEGDPIGKLPLAMANTVPQVRQWLHRMMCKVQKGPRFASEKRKTLSGRTVKNALSLLRRALQHAVDMGLLESNAARDVEVPRAAFATKRQDFDGVLEEDEQARLLRTTEAIDDFSVMLRVSLGLGLRLAELLGLRWCDVHLMAKDPHVLVRTAGKGGPTKGGKPRRLPLFGMAYEALLAWRLLTVRARRHVEQLELYGAAIPLPPRVPTFASHDEPEEVQPGPVSKGTGLAVEGLETGPGAAPGAAIDAREEHAHDTHPSPPPMRVATPSDVAGDDLVFPGRRGGQRTKAPVPEFRQALKAAGIRQVRWHDLRHTCGTSLLMGWWGRQWTVAEVQRFLGHGSAAMTEKYLHARNELIFQAAREMRSRDAKGT